MVASITGITVRERIPDRVFDNADQVELVDIEPEDLIERLHAGQIYLDTQAQKALTNFFSIEKSPPWYKHGGDFFSSINVLLEQSIDFSVQQEVYLRISDRILQYLLLHLTILHC